MSGQHCRQGKGPCRPSQERSSTVKAQPRIRFNWGYWDGRAAAEAGLAPAWSRGGRSHFDKAYEAGYWAGRGSAGETSEPAWLAYKGGR